MSERAKLKWAVYEDTPEGLPHVIPLSDIKPHEHSLTCWCHPRVDVDVIVHNSGDGREKLETAQ